MFFIFGLGGDVQCHVVLVRKRKDKPRVEGRRRLADEAKIVGDLHEHHAKNMLKNKMPK